MTDTFHKACKHGNVPEYLTPRAIQKSVNRIVSEFPRLPDVLLVDSCDKDDYWWRFSVTQGHSFGYLANHTTSQSELRRRLLSLLTGEPINSDEWSNQDRDTEGSTISAEADIVEGEELIWGAITEILISDHDEDEDDYNRGNTTAYGLSLICGITDDEGDPFVGASTLSVAPPECQKLLAKIVQSRTAPRESFESTLTAYDAMVELTKQFALEDHGYPNMYVRGATPVVARRTDNGWTIMGLGTTVYPHADDFEYFEEDADTSNIIPISAELDDSDPNHEYMISWLEYTIRGSLPDDVESDVDMDMERILSIIKDIKPIIQEQIANLDVYDRGKTPKLSRLLNLIEDSIECLFDEDEDLLATVFADLRNAASDSTQGTVSVAGDARTYLKQRYLDQLKRSMLASLVMGMFCSIRLVNHKMCTSKRKITIPADDFEILSENLQDVIQQGPALCDTHNRKKWLQKATYLHRCFKKATTNKNKRAMADPAKVTKLLTQLEERSDPFGLKIVSVPQRSFFSALNLLQYYDEWEPSGPGGWQLGQDDRLPRLMAVKDDDVGLPPVLIVLPPVIGDLIATYDPQYWIDQVTAAGWEYVTVPVDDAYSTCSYCQCPLIPQDGLQRCPHCGQHIPTRNVSAAVQQLLAVSIYFEDENELVDAAINTSGVFSGWLVALAIQSQIGIS